MAKIRDPRSLHNWIYTEHNAYTAAGWVSRAPSAPEVVEIY
jgi:hypothetical protein